MLVDALNPKIVLFFLAFIPRFLNAVKTSGFLVSVALGSAFLDTGAIVNGSIAYLAALGAHRVSGRISQWIRCRIPGGVLVFLGLRLLWEETWLGISTRAYRLGYIDQDFLFAVAVFRVPGANLHLAYSFGDHHPG